MIKETALLTIRPGTREDFEKAVAQARPYFQSAAGALSFSLSRQIEDENLYVLTVGWVSVEAHTESFRNSSNFAAWRELVSPYFAKPPEVYHTTHVYTGF